MEKAIYEVYSFESNEWVEAGKYDYDHTEEKYRRISEIEEPVVKPFRQPNRLDLMSNAEKAITLAMYVIEKYGASEKLTNAQIKLDQARSLIYEHYRELNQQKEDKR